jgi:hypothetical protein
MSNRPINTPRPINAFVTTAALLAAMCSLQSIHAQDTSTDCFEIFPVENPAPGFAAFDRSINVLGILDVYTEPGVSDAKLLHVATITAELLDNDENGDLDHAELCNLLANANAFMPIFSSEGSPAENELFDNFDGSTFCASAVLYADEVSPENPADWFEEAVVEEVLHTINHCGHVSLYPAAFDLAPNASLLTAAMDVARGGQFTTFPSSYPAAAWYHYDDNTCDYECMAIEYLYWCTVSHMGLLDDPNICAAIANEWEPCTPEQFTTTDELASSLITNPIYGIPLIAPDGSYCDALNGVPSLNSSPEVELLAWSPGPGQLTTSSHGLALQLFDATGKLVATSKNGLLALHNLLPGIYLVHLEGVTSVKVCVW